MHVYDIIKLYDNAYNLSGRKIKRKKEKKEHCHHSRGLHCRLCSRHCEIPLDKILATVFVTGITVFIIALIWVEC